MPSTPVPLPDHENLDAAVSSFTCDPPEGFDRPRLECVLGECTDCPSLPSCPDLEREDITISWSEYGKETVLTQKGDGEMRSRERLTLQARHGSRKDFDKLYKAKLADFRLHQYVKREQHAHIRARQDAVLQGTGGNTVDVNVDYQEAIADKPCDELQAENRDTRSATMETSIIRAALVGSDGEIRSYRRSQLHISDDPEQSGDVSAAHLHHMIGDMFTRGELRALRTRGRGDEGGYADEDVESKRRPKVQRSSDGCPHQYKGTPSMYVHGQLATTHDVILDSAFYATSHGRTDGDADGGDTKQGVADEQLKQEPRIDRSNPAWGREVASFVNNHLGMMSRGGARMNAKRVDERLTSERTAVYYEKAEIELNLSAIGGPAPGMKTAALADGWHGTYHFLFDPRDGAGFMRYRMLSCACAPCRRAIDRAEYATAHEKCLLAPIYGERNKWHLTDLKKSIQAKGRSEQATRATAQAHQDLMLQEETDEFVDTSVKAGLTYAMQAIDEGGDDDFWLIQPAVDGARTVEEDFDDPLMLAADGVTKLRHKKGDRVVDAYFYYDVVRRPRCYTLDKGTTVSVPSHMIFCMEGFEMPLASAPAASKGKPKGKKSSASARAAADAVYCLADDVYDTILELMPEPWTDEYLQAMR